MTHKKSKKEKAAEKRLQAKPKREESVVTRAEDDDKMDFGGLPDRDLKKNLGGCP